MARQAHSTIENELLRAGLARDDAMRRARIASAIVGTGAYFGEREAARLRAHFAQGYVGLAAVEAIEESLLSGAWREIDASLREQAREQALDPNEKAEPSHIQHATEANPYGWRKPDTLRVEDHDQPGAWNAYRQTPNLTAAERVEAGARDHRIRGCTRWEVLGNDRQPTVEFDAMAVAVAQGRALAAPAGGVYGE